MHQLITISREIIPCQNIINNKNTVQNLTKINASYNNAYFTIGSPDVSNSNTTTTNNNIGLSHSQEHPLVLSQFTCKTYSESEKSEEFNIHKSNNHSNINSLTIVAYDTGLTKILGNIPASLVAISLSKINDQNIFQIDQLPTFDYAKACCDIITGLIESSNKHDLFSFLLRITSTIDENGVGSNIIFILEKIGKSF
jgi:hypothetical protein